ncbi:CDC73 domain-containing protein [Plasmodium brasilianum]|uniref:Cell division control protein 73 C-terminal domain-containing protein n=2 Tax=Plasmodium (Plasmodium) TaxID=418103 RepID=A0A1D3RHZ0_PLAMA|nr:conserved Plasmodium protein, unknown function [Plasmodium malariae]KAI4837774.1 CDC73 domain-containing protein [Plasmodium brasilianum]SCN44774.1 conserved Plasmodium protein, unknown function [Plasmodium malariae]
MKSEQLNLKALMKKFLGEEKEYIKFMKKDNKDIIVFEKENFYIYSDVLCGIESRKKEKYNIGDIYLFICLPKSNYTFSYINSIGYKYISILERSKIIKNIEDDEDNDDIKVNFYIYDLKKIIDLHDYVRAETEHIIGLDLFDIENVGDLEREYENDNENDRKDLKTKKRKIIATSEGINLHSNSYNHSSSNNNNHSSSNNNNDNITKEDGQKRKEKLGVIIKQESTTDKDNYNVSLPRDENIVSFENTKKIFDSDKIQDSLIFYVKNDYAYSCSYKKPIIVRGIEMNGEGKYNFVEEDLSSLSYDQLMYFNFNEINAVKEGDNETNNSFVFIKQNGPISYEEDASSRYLNLSSDMRGMSTIKNEDTDNVAKNRYSNNEEKKRKGTNYYESNEERKYDYSYTEEINYNFLNHYYEDNYLKNLFFQNLNLYSIIKNTYFTNLSNMDQIDQNVKLITQKFYDEYIKYMEGNKYTDLCNGNNNLNNYDLNNGLKSYININDERSLIEILAANDTFELDLALSKFDEQPKTEFSKHRATDDHGNDNSNNNNNLNSNHNSNHNSNRNNGIAAPFASLKKRKRIFLFSEVPPIEIVRNFSNHDKIIFFHNLLALYICSLNSKKYYKENKTVVNFVHNFVLNFDPNFANRKCPFGDDLIRLNSDPGFTSGEDTCSDDIHINDSKNFSFELNGKNKLKKKGNQEGDSVLMSNIKNEDETVERKNNNKKDSLNFRTIDNNYLEIKNRPNNKFLFNYKLSDTEIDNNKELVNSSHVKEVNVKDSYDIVGKCSCDYTMIYNFFEKELFKKSSIKNVYINGIKKNIIVDDNIKPSIQKKTLKLIDEIHLTHKKRPIIILEKGSTNIINRSNIESFFLHNNLDSSFIPTINNSSNNNPVQSINKSSDYYDSLSIIFKMFNKSVKFSFIENDKITKFTETDWKCVIAAILNSKESLKKILNIYPFQIPTALFQPFKTFVFMYNDVTIPSDLLSGSNIDIIRISRSNRKDDYIAVNKFWSNIEKFLLQRREKIFYIKKKKI